MQRFDVFFKKVFSRHHDYFLALLRNIIPEDVGAKVVHELPVEIVKGALRVDKIFRTNNNITLLIDFEEVFTLDAYFEILTHTAAHIHSTKAYNTLFEEKQSKLGYVPLLIAIKTNKKHMKYLKNHNVVEKVTVGAYRLQDTPFFCTYMLVLTEMNLAKYMLRVAKLCDTEEKCQELAKQVRTTEFWDTRIAKNTTQLKKIRDILLEKFGELILLLNLDVKYVFRVWRYASSERKDISKGILDSMLILFLKEVRQMSVSQVLTKREKKELIEAMGIKEAIEAVGLEKVVEEVGLEKVVEALSNALKLSKKDKEVLNSILKKAKNK